MQIENKIVKALNNVGELKGIVCTANFKHELGYKAKYINDYLAASVLAELIKDGKIQLIFKAGREDKRMKYFFKLLKY